MCGCFPSSRLIPANQAEIEGRPEDESIGENEDQMERFLSIVQEGDHIYSERKGGLYDHHGIYMGNQIVAHVRKDGGSSNLCKKCTASTTERPPPTHSCIDCFRLHQPCYIIRYREPEQWRNVSFFTSGSIIPKTAFYGYKSNKLYAEWCKDGRYGYFEISKRKCKEYSIVIEDLIKLSRFSSSKSAEQVKEIACEDYPCKYNLLVANCEDFAVFCKAGRHRSMQAEKRMCGIYMTFKWVHQLNTRRKGRATMRKYLASLSYEEPADEVPVPVEALVDKPNEVLKVDKLEEGLRIGYPQEDEDPIIVKQEEGLRLLKAQEDPILDKQDKSLMLKVEKPEYIGPGVRESWAAQSSVDVPHLKDIQSHTSDASRLISKHTSKFVAHAVNTRHPGEEILLDELESIVESSDSKGTRTAGRDRLHIRRPRLHIEESLLGKLGKFAPAERALVAATLQLLLSAYQLFLNSRKY